MKNVLKILGIICVIGAVIFITACPGGDTPDPTFTVTFDSDGGSAVPAQSGIAKDGLAADPGAPTKTAATEPTTAGFFKLASGTFTFIEWQLNGVAYDFNTPVTTNITLKAKWSLDNYSSPDLSSTLTDADDIVSKAVTWLKTGNNAGTDQFVLALADNVAATTAIVMTKGNLKIKNVGGQKTITGYYTGLTPTTNAASPVGPFIIGDTTNTASSGKPTLTLVNIGLRGNCTITERSDGTATLTGDGYGDSLVRVWNGATLILDEGSSIKGHKNTATAADGLNGNGSAVCVYGPASLSTGVTSSTLIMKAGSVIEHNESTDNTSGNRNKVGGIYTYQNAILDITGGQVVNNICTEGNTADIYATDGGTFKLSGNVVIKEITLNGDYSSYPTTIDNAGSAVRAVIEVSNLGPLADVKLSLRSSTAQNANANDAVNVVKKVWVDQVVLKAPTGSTLSLSDADLAKFTLKDFKYRTGFTVINPTRDEPLYKIDSTGKFVAVTP